MSYVCRKGLRCLQKVRTCFLHVCVCVRACVCVCAWRVNGKIGAIQAGNPVTIPPFLVVLLEDERERERERKRERERRRWRGKALTRQATVRAHRQAAEVPRPAGPGRRRACVKKWFLQNLPGRYAAPRGRGRLAQSVCVAWGRFLKIICVGIPTYAGVKTGF